MDQLSDLRRNLIFNEYFLKKNDSIDYVVPVFALQDEINGKLFLKNINSTKKYLFIY